MACRMNWYHCLPICEWNSLRNSSKRVWRQSKLEGMLRNVYITNITSLNLEQVSWAQNGFLKWMKFTPKNVKLFKGTQMAGTGEVLRRLTRSPGVRYPVLVPNQKGLDILRELLSSANNPRLVDEIAVFVAATDSFNRANLNMTTAECLSRLEPVIRNAKDMRMRVRGYVSVVITCPFSGETNPEKVAQVSKELLDMVHHLLRLQLHL